MRHRAFLWAVAALAVAPWAGAPGPWAAEATLEVGGEVRDAAGTPVSANLLLRFGFLDAAGREAWSESQYVRVSQGAFTTVLGRARPLPAASARAGHRLSVEAPAGSGFFAREMPRKAAKPEPRPEAPEAAQTPKSPAPVETAAAAPAAQRPSAPPDEAVRTLQKKLDALEAAMKGRAKEEPKSRVYEVRPGDTLRGIAQAVYGNPEFWADIYQANFDRIQRGGDLVPGQKLVLPPVQ